MRHLDAILINIVNHITYIVRHVHLLLYPSHSFFRMQTHPIMVEKIFLTKQEDSLAIVYDPVISQPKQ